MKSSTLLKRITGIAAGVVLTTAAAFAQINTDVELTVTNGASVKSMRFGINTAATEGIDAALGEQSLPPFPPAGVYEARFVNYDGTSIGQGSPKNYRPSPQSGSKSYRIKWQPATGTPQIVVAWNSAAVLAAYTTATITPQGGSAINMLASNSFTVADGENEATYATITVSGPKAPPAPLAITSSCPNDFGTLNLPTGGSVTRTRQFTLTNNTDSSIVVNSILSNDTNFTIGSLPASLLPGNTDVDVTFTASAIGSYSTIVTVDYASGSTATCDAVVNVVSGEGLYWTQTTNSYFDNSLALYTNDIGLQYSGSTPLNGIQFVVTVPNRTLLVDDVVIGSDVPNPSNWEFLYRVVRSSTATEIRVVMYALDGVSNLPAGDYDELVKIFWNVADINDCDGASGGDTRALTAVLSDVESSLFGDTGADGGVGTDANRDEAAFTIYNRSARGDVNCDDVVDVMDVLDVNDQVLGLTSLAPWQRNRADLAPWSSYWSTPGAFFSDETNYGNSAINVGDLTLLTNAIVNENWPDNQPLGRTRAQLLDAPGAVTGVGIYDVKLTFDVEKTGVKVFMENKAPVKGLQLKFKAADAPAGLQGRISESLGVKFNVTTLVKDGEVRMIAITSNGQPIEPRTGDLLAFDFAISDIASIIVVEPISIGGADNKPMLVEYEVNQKVSSVEYEVAEAAIEAVPNPFSAATEIRFSVAHPAVVNVTVADAAGNNVRELLVNESLVAGRHAISFDASGLASGVYYVTVAIGGKRSVHPLIVAE